MPRALVIANPAAGTADTDALLEALGRVLASPWTYDVHMTEKDEDLAGLVREHAGNVDTVIAVGGDGTVRLVASGMVGSEANLAIVPGGTGNVVARDTGVPLDLDAALALVTGEHDVLSLDALGVGDTYGFANVSMGLSVGVVKDAASEQKQRLGVFAYVLSGAKNLSNMGVQDVSLVVDGKQHFVRATEVMVANCPSLGIPEFRAPVDILPSDGIAHVIAVQARHLHEYLHIGRDLLVNREHLGEHVRIFPAEHEVRIETIDPHDVQADGDLVGKTPVTVNVVRGAVRLLVPRQAARA